MGSVRIVRWLLGWTEFSVSEQDGASHSVERFLNLAARMGINLWGIRREKDRFYVRAAVRNYSSLRAPAKRARVKLRAGKRAGLPFFLKRCGRRKGLFVGGAMFLLILAVMPLFVWEIDIQGAGKISEGEIRAAAARYGLTPGLGRWQLNTSDLEQKLMLEFPDIGWVTLNTNGSVVTIVIDEKVEKPEMTDPLKYANVTAARAGQLLRLDVYEGTAQASEGSAVAKGQLLISGVVEDAFGKSTLHHARGMALAETKRAVEIEVPMKTTESVSTGKTIERSSVQLLGLNIPISFAREPEGSYQRETERQSVEIQGFRLPAYVFTERWIEVETRQISLTKEQALEKARQEFETFVKENWEGIKVVSKTENGKVDGEVYRLEIVCVCEEDIAVESEILLN